MKCDWRLVGSSVAGANHLRNNLPNQDAISWIPVEGTGSEIVVALADGHGSPNYFRSDIGARFAVEVAIYLISKLLSEKDLLTAKQVAMHYLPQNLEKRWKWKVKNHLKDCPFPRDHGAQLENEYKPYGCTVLAAAVTDEYLLFLKLGDGDILTINNSGDVHEILAPSEPQLGEETDSLCSRNAWTSIKVQLSVLADDSPALVLLSTDGYSNSFVSSSDFQKAASDYLGLLRDNPILSQEKLSQQISEVSKQGSGDDISLALLYCI